MKNRNRAKAPQGNGSVSMADALFSSTKQRVLGLLFGQPERQFFATELIKLARKGSGSVQRELALLTETGLINLRALQKQKYYQANEASPIYGELRSLIGKTFGLADPIRAALNGVKNEIDLAVIYGSVAKGRETASSDVDLLIVSKNLGLQELYSLLEPVETKIARKIECTLYSPSEFRDRVQNGNPFLQKVLEGELIYVVGDQDVLKRIG